MIKKIYIDDNRDIYIPSHNSRYWIRLMTEDLFHKLYYKSHKNTQAI